MMEHDESMEEKEWVERVEQEDRAGWRIYVPPLASRLRQGRGTQLPHPLVSKHGVLLVDTALGSKFHSLLLLALKSKEN